MPERIYTPPTKTLDKQHAPFWRGQTAERIVARRLKQYAKEKKAKLVARRKQQRKPAR